jgi:hypothetical protein
MFKIPSFDNNNKLTWKCKIFGCRDEWHPVIFHDNDERHGITEGFSWATAATLITEITFKGCHWCNNYQKIVEELMTTFPAWICDCNICVSANQHRKWLYE